MHMSLKQQANSSDELSKMYSAIRKKTVKEKWEKLGTDFRKYTEKVSRLLFDFIRSQCSIWTYADVDNIIQMRLLQDGNPEVFAQWTKTTSSSSIDHL